MNRPFAHVLPGFAALLLGVLSATAVPLCKPVVGSFQAAAVPPGQGHCPEAAPLCTAGRVWGGIQGSFSQSVVQGQALGTRTAQWVVQHHFESADRSGVTRKC
jgi:hypothetical protein